MSWLEANVQIGLFVQRAFESMDHSLERAHDALLVIDDQFRDWLRGLPSWWKEGGPVPDMPQSYRVRGSGDLMLA